MGMTFRWRPGPIAASIFAGFVGAGVLDALVAAVRAAGSGAPGSSLGALLGSLLILGVGLHGVTGLLAAISIGTLAGAVLRAGPEGARAWLADERRDTATATGLLAASLGILVMAALVAVGHKIVVRPMQSDKLATIAVAGLVLATAPLGGAVAIALLGPLGRWVTPRPPRTTRLGPSGALLATGAVCGVLAAVGAFSRADWRALDLSPFIVLVIAVGGGTFHALFWYRSRTGRSLRLPVPASALFGLCASGVLAAFWLASRMPAGNPAFRAAEEGSLGMRLALRIARAATDRDGDSFSARFGGGDCDDERADVYPGAEDIPGNNVDENREGGDAIATGQDEASAPVAQGPDGDGDGDGDGDAKADSKLRASGAAEPAAAPAAGGSPHGVFKGNILIVTIDALRADRLGVSGYKGPRGMSLTPNLDALARRGAYFRRVWSQAPNTPRSFPAILTSQYPSAVKWDKPTVNYPLLLPSNHTFFEDLNKAGLSPIGIFSHFYFTADRGVSKDFKEWSNDRAGTISESNKDSASPRIVPQVVARLEKAAAT